MEAKNKTDKNLQWHPAFYAGIQIELQDDAENLLFENEHQLGTKPFGIDVLIIKKANEKPTQKNIGKIFRKHNIIEYKSPTDYLSIDDFYKVYGYTCFYKADVATAESIKINELTISLVCKKYPRKLIQHLEKERNFEIKYVDRGIYYVIGDKIPIQIIVTKKLSPEENLWLRSLTDDLEGTKEAENLLRDYQNHAKDTLYQSIMNIIIQANEKKFEEVLNMCEALEALINKKLDEKELEWKRIGEKSGEEIGKEIGKEIGEKLINDLNIKLAQSGRTDDIIKAAQDKEYQNKLIQEFGL